jgi:hypothetical protein
MSNLDEKAWRTIVQPAIAEHIARGHPFIFICVLPDDRVVVTRGAKIVKLLQVFSTLATSDPEDDNDVPWYDLLTDAINMANTYRAKERLSNATDPEEDHPF